MSFQYWEVPHTIIPQDRDVLPVLQCPTCHYREGSPDAGSMAPGCWSPAGLGPLSQQDSPLGCRWLVVGCLVMAEVSGCGVGVSIPLEVRGVGGSARQV